MTELVMRPLNTSDPAELRTVVDLAARVFIAPRLTDEELDARREHLATQRVAVVTDQDDIVASFRSWDSSVSVPGGAVLQANAVSGVVVSPTHKRRGLLSRWMKADLAQAKEAGNVASVLWASEATIYGRFGFGPITASTHWTLEVPRAAGFRQPTPGRVRVLTPDEVEPLLGDLFARVQSRHAGTIARTPISWQAMLGRIAPAEAFKKRWFAAHFDDAGVIDGVVVYDHKDVWQDWMPAAEVHIDDFLAATDEAEEALWQYCASIDFVTSIEFETSPELPMAAWLTNPRAARTRSTWDGMWARILDTPAALSARTYEVPGTVVLQVNDELAGGRFALTVDESGAATCEPTTAEPDLVLGAGELATLWFGLAHGTGSLDAMRRLGRVQVDPAKIGWLSAFFSTTWRRQGITHF